MNMQNAKMSLLLLTVAILSGTLATGVFAGEGKVSREGSITVYTQPEQARNAASTIDFRGAKPMPMPMPAIDVLPPQPCFDDGIDVQSGGTPGFQPGRRGNGDLSLRQVLSGSERVAENGSLGAMGDVTPQELGTSELPFTTMRVDLVNNYPSAFYPYSAAGKVFFKDGNGTYVCSGSLIKRGVVVTAAHCVADFGQQRFYSNWTFIPALSGDVMPYGQWSVKKAYVKSSYFKGTDSCAVAGIVCKNDLAVLLLNPQGGAYPGTSTGWLGFGWNGYGFNSKKHTLINQLGYPQSHDSGILMQRTDSEGFVSRANSRNTVWGSRQTGGSSGGPEVVNLGIPATLDTTTGFGSAAHPNIVIGVTSWGYTDPVVKLQGASPFTDKNVLALNDRACKAAPAACQ
jgi:V8-like Glu-specific endopeptidase